MLDAARGRLVDAGFAAGWGVLKAVPAGMSERAFRAVADAATVRNGGGAKQLRKNLRRVVGPEVSELRMDRLVGASLRSYSRYWLETFRLPKMDHRDVVARTNANTEGAEHLRAALASGRSFVMALPHMGNWDVAALWLVNQGAPFTTVAERLQPESLFDRFVAYRESLGMEVLALTGGQRPPADVLADRLRSGRGVCLVADRDISRNGIEVQFFGEATRMPGGPALLAATTGADLLPVGLWFTDDGWGQRIHAPVQLPDGNLRDKVVAGTQSVADAFAHDIAEHPTDWHMLQRLWLDDLPPRPSRTAAAAAS
ncbi:MAG: phosphatidylinositol dimannoside acyltransferase [Pseudonocardiales bacterium]|jgi:KDO2-lipid IV(A) lauroyltransferase|nr:phosphatidylinositol dimannoside acyltransferase [Pseudonocardiales bacterium]